MPSIGQFSALKVPEANLPAVTYGMLIDFLGKDRVIYGPYTSKRVFRWLKVRSMRGFEPAENIRTGQLLHVCSIEHAQTLLEESPEIFICACCHENEAPDWAELYPGRFMLVRTEDAFLYFCFLIMKLFTDALLLRVQLDRAAKDERSLQALLEAAQSAIDADLSCHDANGYELARSIEKSSSIGGPSQHVVKRDVVAEGLVFATMEMLTRNEASQGQIDLFDLCCNYAQELCRALWDEQSHLACPHRQLFVDLIEGRAQGSMADEDIRMHTRLDRAVQFKLILLEQEDNRRMSFSNVSTQARLINRKRCHVFAYQGSICVLCYAGEGDNLLSHQKTLADVRKHLGKLGVRAVSSQIFESLLDLDLAYEQAVIARNTRPLIMKEAGGESSKAKYDVVPFEVCLIYYLIGEDEKSDRLLNFTFSHTLMQKLSIEDAQNGTAYLDMFWHYLLSERNATAVAERLHVHRNTVIYRMNKIQTRFDLDLSDPDVRERMIIDFKMFFLLQGQRKD